MLTSENIQATFFEATKRRKTPKPTKYIVNVNSNSQSETVNADINTQSKVKESKVNKSKVNKKETESCINPSSPETSVEKAFFEEPLGEEKLTELIRYYSQNVSPATPVNITDLQYDLADFDGDLELLKEAVNICARNNERRYSYFAGILKNWRANGVKTYADYLNNERERADKKTQNKQYQNKPVRQEKVPEWMNQANGEEEKLSPEEQAELDRQIKDFFGGKMMDELVKLVEEWAKEKRLDKAEPEKQMLKVIEEVGEVGAALARNNKNDLRDGIGDVVVTLVILAMQNDMDLYECLNQAYNEIKDRKGKNVNGVFVKEADL
ncbi:recombinase [Enterococcus phage phiFL2A]|uniref:Recombinase n=1 Tax=Enterococcus phage phiFL2A TaxID=673835 RepID=D2IZE0_9CAUD|nr:recombinase [Enterococcus phage phiFL2A]ACZ63917.1 recombinase [Enterococcus phage phiFL2A]